MLFPTLQLSMAMTHGLLHIMPSTTTTCHGLVPKIFQEKNCLLTVTTEKKNCLHTMVPWKNCMHHLKTGTPPPPVNIKWFVPYRIMFLFNWYLSIRTRQIMPGGGDFVSFFWPGGRSFALKSCPRGVLTKKISDPAVSTGGGDGNRSNWYLHNSI